MLLLLMLHEMYFLIPEIPSDIEEITSIKRRQTLSRGRQFTENQKFLIVDYMENGYCLDPTSSFSLRPPELVCVTLQMYIQYFLGHINLKQKIYHCLTMRTYQKY